MTALKRYQRLEATGLWRAERDAQRRDVVVSFGEASLVISDGRSAQALTHWSLPAVSRLNPGETPALYSPDGGEDETLEIDDESMIEALETVHRALLAGQARSGRVRGGIFAAIILGLAGLGVFWLPGALVEHTAAVVPMAKRVQIGQAVLADMVRNGAQPCRGRLGVQALARLQSRVLGPEGRTIQLVVFDPGAGQSGAPASLRLPGRMLLLNRSVIEAHDSPEIAAAHVLVGAVRAENDDPLVPLLEHAGFRATFRLLTTGNLPETATAGYGAVALAREPELLDPEVLLPRFQTADLRSTPYAYATDPSGETTLRLIEADPFRNADPDRSLLSDGDWVSLQGICFD